MSVIAAAGAITSMKDKGYYRRTMDFLKEEKEYLADKIGRISPAAMITTPCNFVLIRIADPPSDMEERFLQQNMLIRFYEEDDGTCVICLPVRRHVANAQFVRVLRRILGGS